MLIKPGFPFLPIALVRNRKAAFLSRLAVSKKSMVLPCLLQKFAEASEGEITLAYLPRYALELNPDEQVWNHTKSTLGQKFIDTKDEMKRLAINALRSIQKRKALARAFFQLDTTKYAAA